MGIGKNCRPRARLNWRMPVLDGFSKFDSFWTVAKSRVRRQRLIVDEAVRGTIEDKAIDTMTLFAPHNLRTMIETWMSVKAMIMIIK